MCDSGEFVGKDEGREGEGEGEGKEEGGGLSDRERDREGKGEEEGNKEGEGIVVDNLCLAFEGWGSYYHSFVTSFSEKIEIKMCMCLFVVFYHHVHLDPEI